MSNLKYAHILSYVMDTPWAILPSKWAMITEFLSRKMAEEISGESEPAQIVAVTRSASRVSGNVAILPLYGTIIPRGNMLTESSGATSLDKFTAQFRALMADPGIGAIVLDIDSPGGAVTGVDEMASEIYTARKSKPIYAIASPMAASAAYWLGTAASEFSVIPTGEVGSIGVFAAHEDVSGLMAAMGVKTTLISAGKYKTEGNPYEALTDDARAAIQERVDDYYDMFISAVARNRGASQSAVREGFGEGRVVGARKAQKLGMIDYVETMDEMMDRILKRNRKDKTRADDPSPVVVAEADTNHTGHNDDLELRRRRLRLAGRR